MYDLLLLGSLITGDKTGYKLQKIVGSALQPMRKVSSGVLYPSLERLEKDGLVTSRLYEEGRKIKLWHITSEGVARFIELMKEKIPSDAKRNDMIHFKLRSLDSVTLADQLAILNEFKLFIEKDLAFYQQAQEDMAAHQERFPENAERFRILAEAYELDIQMAQTKRTWINKQIADRKPAKDQQD
ncbi:PadR family transcriptional regulator [Enterococcus pseudoavium]|uniref:PadR family transcriptional regulator n=1 Tax=Enterococcus pseudoavium TaxID=44007 RepID=A0AAE4L1G0_9ENTE|nr:PadR family transcriptional regulator [Enterococcus pseudoavium]MDT2735603.1 PadR family transcriptional regulator [Enterococcus pseudoavium]MDT2754569.1 PadR family transcriptional regulator [Enterococcus pseudoavium]MDT2769376.1 PadR family transcriptional regulator [Enterococcus pseudoavium]REC31133.1 PadR family transcriptional regulator [Enterococcus pseudoavium]